MTLAEHCESIWPCGWLNRGVHYEQTYTRARISGDIVEVSFDNRKFLVFVHGKCFGGEQLRPLLEEVYALLVRTPNVPALSEVT